MQPNHPRNLKLLSHQTGEMVVVPSNLTSCLEFVDNVFSTGIGLKRVGITGSIR